MQNGFRNARGAAREELHGDVAVFSESDLVVRFDAGQEVLQTIHALIGFDVLVQGDERHLGGKHAPQVLCLFDRSVIESYRRHRGGFDCALDLDG